MNLYENADQEKFIEATSAGISDLDTQVMAENVNAALRIINSIHEEKPELFTTLLRGFADSVDEEELQKPSNGWFRRCSVLSGVWHRRPSRL